MMWAACTDGLNKGLIALSPPSAVFSIFEQPLKGLVVGFLCCWMCFFAGSRWCWWSPSKISLSHCCIHNTQGYSVTSVWSRVDAAVMLEMWWDGPSVKEVIGTERKLELTLVVVSTSGHGSWWVKYWRFMHSDLLAMRWRSYDETEVISFIQLSVDIPFTDACFTKLAELNSNLKVRDGEMWRFERVESLDLDPYLWIHRHTDTICVSICACECEGRLSFKV